MPMSLDVNVGDLAILQRAAYHPTCNGALAETVAPEQWRASLTSARCRRPAQRLSMARLVVPVDGDLTFAAARDQLWPLPDVGEGTWPQDVTRYVFRCMQVPQLSTDNDRPSPLSPCERSQ